MKNKAWFFNQITLDLKQQFDAWQSVDVQIMRLWTWEHPEYWTVKITQKVIDDVIRQFNDGVRWVDLVVDENHERDHKALWIFRELYQEWDWLFAKIELTKRGAEALTNWDYFYFSPEIQFWPYKEEETGATIENLLIGGAFTNRPFFKKMEAVMANESSGQQKWTYLFLFRDSMNEFRKLLEAAKAKDKMLFSEKVALITKFNDLSEEEQKEVEQEVQELVDGSEWEEGDKNDDTPPADDKKEPVKATDPTQSTQYNELKAELLKTQYKLRCGEVEKKFSEQFAFSTETGKWVFNPVADKEDFMNLYMSFSEEQAQKFDALFGKIDLTIATKFKEVGHDWSSVSSKWGSDEQKFHEVASRIAKEKSISYHEAAQLVTADDLK